MALVNTRTVTLRRSILAVLRTCPEADLSTTEICKHAGYNNFEHHAYVGPQLRALARSGVITQTERPPGGAARWQLNRADQTDAAFNAATERDSTP